MVHLPEGRRERGERVLLLGYLSLGAKEKGRGTSAH